MTILLAGAAFAVDKQPADRLMEAHYSMVGLRLGAWVAQTAAPKVTDVSVDADMPDAGFYTELFWITGWCRYSCWNSRWVSPAGETSSSDMPMTVHRDD